MPTFANVPLSVVTPEAQDWVDRNVRPEDVFHWNDQTGHPGLEYTDLRSRPVQLGHLYWPTGASQWAVGYYLVTSSQLVQIQRKVYGSVYSAADLKLSDGAKTITTSLWMLPPRPLAYAPGKESMYLLTLVDDRYWWWDRRGVLPVVAGVTTWGDLIDSYETILGVTLQQSGTVASKYLRPSLTFSSEYDPIPPSLDAAATAVGQRVVRRLDGTVYLQTASEAFDVEELEFQKSRSVMSGGRWSLLPGKPGDWQAIMPGDIDVVFPRLDDGYPGSAPQIHTVTLESVRNSHRALSSAKGNSETHVLHVPAVASYTSAVWTNQSELETLGTALAEDWYLWQTANVELRYAGIEDWIPTGRNRAVEWVVTADECYTRIYRPVMNPRAERLPVTGTAGEIIVDPIPPGGTIIYEDITIIYDGTTTNNYNSTTIINYDGPTINYIDDTEININSGVTVDWTGPGTLDISITTVNITAGTWTFDSDTVVVFNGFLEICGYWAWCYYTHSAQTVDINELDISLSARRKPVQRVPVNADINLSSIKVPDTTKGIHFAILNTGTNTLTLKHQDVLNGTASYLLNLPNGIDVDLEPNGMAQFWYDPVETEVALLGISHPSTGSGVTGLNDQQILYGAADGTIDQEAAFKYDEDTNTMTIGSSAAGLLTADDGNITLQTEDNSAKSVLAFKRAEASTAQVSAGGDLGSITWDGADVGSSYSPRAEIACEATTNDGGEIVFLTSSGSAPEEIFRIDENGFLVFDDSSVVRGLDPGNSNGFKMGTGSTDLLGFYGVTPVTQPSHVSDASTSHSVTGSDTVDQAGVESALNALGTKINSVISLLESLGLKANS